ncbi:hypothetical protein NDU88_003723 [Pleurodeles waltl]|uniref:Uncharacterized protein n=1 Tax=Pleurodeles waltl TaxID=8319 RepID=A0AAV7RDQ6_PLEWA|nr:hypothetical protein NDU88_003723 [Pleurodeles waltl]
MKKKAGRERGEEEERAEEEQNTQQEGCRRGAESEGKKDSRGAERGWRRERKAEDRGTGEESNLKGEMVALAVRMRLRDVAQHDQERKLPKIIAETYSSIGRDTRVTASLHKIDPEALSYVDDISLMDDELLQHLRRVACIVVGFAQSTVGRTKGSAHGTGAHGSCTAYADNEYLHYWHQYGFRDSKGNTIKHRLLWGKVADLKEMLPNVHVVHTLGHQRVAIHVAGNVLADEAAKSAVAVAAVAAVTLLSSKPDADIRAAVIATADSTPYPKGFPNKYHYRMGGTGRSWLNLLYGVQRALNILPGRSLVGRTSYECLFRTQMYVPDLDAPGVEAAETPVDINERVTVLRELQQFCDDNSSISAASTGIKDVPVTSTGWIPKVGDLLHEKVALKKEFGPSYRALVPVLGIHGTRTLILPPLAGAKENCLVSIDNVKLHHVADPAQLTKRNIQ